MEKFLYFIAIHLENSIFGQFRRLYYILNTPHGEDQNALVVVVVVDDVFCQASLFSFFESTPKGVKEIKFSSLSLY